MRRVVGLFIGLILLLVEILHDLNIKLINPKYRNSGSIVHICICIQGHAGFLSSTVGLPQFRRHMRPL